MSDPFYILSIDGGGLRGVFAAHVLKRMEEELRINWRNRFGLMAGTSTGAILAAGLACGRSAANLAEFYNNLGPVVFTPQLLACLDQLRLFKSRYTNSNLKEPLNQVFKDVTLGQVSVPLILPAVDIVNGCVHVFKSSYSDGFVRDSNVRVADAVLASCSAPMYFDPHLVADKYLLADGGIWANNPSLVAAIDAHYRLGISLEDLRVLSIGTGAGKAYYPLSAGKWRDRLVRSWQGWGLLTRWQGSRLLDLILNLQSETAHNTLCLLFKESPHESEQVLRITFESDRPLPMDDAAKTRDWIAKADHQFTHLQTRISHFLST